MFADVVDLHGFYGTATGRVARRILRNHIREIWPDVRGQTVLGLGYASPYLRPFLGEAERVISLMPSAQGVIHWPREGPNRVVLSDDAYLPLPDLSVDRALLIHAVENTEQLRAMMRAVWRVLAGGGRMLVVVPNRRGIWARLDRTPFGHGHPYSPTQLSALLRDCLFAPLDMRRALYLPPTRMRFLLASADAWEGIGERWFKAFAGVILAEASKQIYAAPVRGARARLPLPHTATVPLRKGHPAAMVEQRLPDP